MERQALLFPQPPEDPALPAYAVNDVSGLGAFNFGQMDKPQGVVIHHTGGGGTPEGIMNVFRQRGLATQYIMDREGNIHQALPDGMRGQHIRPSQINGLTNANTLGIEIIAKDDSDVTEKQRDAAARWLTETQAKYGIPAANVFGHGEINRHKQATEGSTVVNNWRAANRIAAPDLGPPAAGGDLPMEQRTLMAFAGRDPRPRPQSSPSSQFDQAFEEASKETGIPVAILKAQAQQESRFNPNAIGRSGEVGLLQVKPSTAAQPGYGVEPVDPAKLTDPAENIRFGARYLAARARAAGVESWNDPQQVAKGLTAYNGGGDPNYAQNVLRYLTPPGQSRGGSQVAAAQPQQTRNPTVQAAAERGRGPIADRPASGAAYVEGQAPMARQMPPDLSNSPDGGARDFMLRQAGMAPDMQQDAPQGGGGGQSLVQMLMGAVGGGGGGQQQMRQPDSIEALIPDNRPNPFAFMGEALMENQQAAQKRQGQIFAAKQLVAQGMSPQDAVAAINSPGIGQQLALGGLQQQKAAREQEALRARLDGGQSGVAAPAPVEAGGAPAPAQTQPGAPAEPAPPARISTGNKTVDTLFGQRSAKVAELTNLLKTPTSPNTEGIVKNRAEALKAEIGNIDKRMEQYAPTGTIKEYTFAMAQRQEQGKPIISLEAFDAEQRKAGATSVNVGGGTDAQVFTEIKDSYKLAKSAASGLKGLQEAKKAVEGGIVSGAGAELQLQLRKIASSAFGVEDEKITNTETFLSAISPQIGAIIQANFGGAQISDGDRKFAQDAAAGRISLDGSSIKRILSIMERSNKAILEDHNRKVDAVYEDAPDGKFKRERALFAVPVPKEEQVASPAPAPAAPPMPPQPSNVRPDGSSPPTPRDGWQEFGGVRIRRVQ